MLGEFFGEALGSHGGVSGQGRDMVVQDFLEVSGRGI